MFPLFFFCCFRIPHYTPSLLQNQTPFRLNRFFHLFSAKPIVIASVFFCLLSLSRDLELSLTFPPFDQCFPNANFVFSDSITPIRNANRYLSILFSFFTTFPSRFIRHAPPRQNTTAGKTLLRRPPDVLGLLHIPSAFPQFLDQEDTRVANAHPFLLRFLYHLVLPRKAVL